MTFLEFGTPYVLMCLFGALCGWRIALRETRAQRAAETYLLEFLTLNGYSLIHHPDPEGRVFWAVTDGSHKVVGVPGFTPRDAIDSAIGHVAFSHTGDKA